MTTKKCYTLPLLILDVRVSVWLAVRALAIQAVLAAVLPVRASAEPSEFLGTECKVPAILVVRKPAELYVLSEFLENVNNTEFLESVLAEQVACSDLMLVLVQLVTVQVSLSVSCG